MKVLKKLIIAIVSAAFIMSSAFSVMADETTAASQPSGEASETHESIDISKLSFDTMYGNQIIDFLNHEYVFDGQKIPLTESNYYFLLTFLQLSQYAAYGYFPATGEGYIDLAATYGENGKTYADYFVQQAEDYLHSTYILLGRAKAAGIKLSDEDKKAIDEEINERIEEQAKPAGVPLDTILKLYFGPDCDEKAYRSILENATLAGKYQEKFAKDYKVPDDQKKVPNIYYALFYAPGASGSSEEVKKAETAANEMLKKCKNASELKTLAEQAQKDGTVYDQGSTPVRKGGTESTFEEWAYDASRKEGDIGIIFSKDYGYFCVGYLGLTELDADELKDMASEALNTEIENEMKAGKHGFKTDKAFPTAKPAPTVPAETGETGTQSGETAPSSLPTDNGTTASDNGMTKVLIVIFVVIGGVAIVAVIVILVMNYMGSGKNEEDDEDEDEDENEGEDEPKKSSSKKVSKRFAKFFDEVEDEEEDENGGDEEYEEYEEESEEAGEAEEEPVEEDPYSGVSEDEEPEEEEEPAPQKPASKGGSKDGGKKKKNNGKKR